MPGIIIRRADLADAKLLTELGTQTFTETFSAENSEENMRAYLSTAFNVAKQAEELLDSQRYCFVGELDGVASGYAMLKQGEPPSSVSDKNAIELVRIYVLKSAVGLGLGGELMKACLELAASLGHKTIWLGVWERNYRAHSFYKRWGFEQVGTHIFQLGDDPQTDFLMQRPV